MDVTAKENFEYSRGIYQESIKQENLAEGRIYDFLTLAASLLLGFSFAVADFIDTVSYIQKFLFIAYLFSLSFVLIIGFLGRYSIYKMWKDGKHYDLANAKSWNSAHLEITKSDDPDTQNVLFRNAIDTEQKIFSLRPNFTTDLFIFTQVACMGIGLICLLALVIARLW